MQLTHIGSIQFLLLQSNDKGCWLCLRHFSEMRGLSQQLQLLIVTYFISYISLYYFYYN
jgi:hypothetical protein